MREKYIMRGIATGVVVGIRYDAKKKELLLGGPKKFMEEWKDKGSMKLSGSRCQIKFDMEEDVWDIFLQNLRKRYIVQSVKSFRRLMG